MYNTKYFLMLCKKINFIYPILFAVVYCYYYDWHIDLQNDYLI